MVGKFFLATIMDAVLKGIGTILVRMLDNQVRERISVRYVPDLKRNLLAVGYSCKLKNGIMKVIKRVMIKLRGKVQNCLYILEAPLWEQLL